VRLGLDDRPPAGAQHAAGRAPQAVVELELEARDADLCSRRHAARLELVAAVVRHRPHLADDLAGLTVQRRGALLALGERRAVAGEDVRARGQRRLAREPLACTQAPEHVVRPPVDAGLVTLARELERQASGERAEDPRAHRHRRLDDAHARAGDLAGPHRFEREDVGGALVGPGEALQAGAPLGLGGEQLVHRGVVGAGPGGQEALRDLDLGLLVARGDERAGGERGPRQDEHRHQPQ
jgi:hypothetical protein